MKKEIIEAFKDAAITACYVGAGAFVGDFALGHDFWFALSTGAAVGAATLAAFTWMNIKHPLADGPR